MTQEEINTRALRLAQELDSNVEEGSFFHNDCKVAIKAAVNATEVKAFDWILKNFGIEASRKYSDEVE